MVSKTGNSITIAVASGKGGTGKTFVSTNIFHALAAQGTRVTLADCDAEAPNAAAFFQLNLLENLAVTQQVPVINANTCTFCGLCHEYCNYGAIFYLPDAGIIQVLDDLCHSCGACTVACRFDAITEKEVEVGEVNTFRNNRGLKLVEAKMRIGAMTPVPVIKKAISVADDFQDILVLDAPPGTSCPFVHTVAAADYVILVTEPTPFGLSDLQQSVETLRQMEKPFGVVINRAGIGNMAVADYLQRENIELLLEIPFSRQTAQLCSEGKLLAESDLQLAGRLINMVQKIKLEYGNSHYKR
jgi:MinD superfamily P-loop ATPase